jgi:anaerobic selenocysteine-containing dehydrogenase
VLDTFSLHEASRLTGVPEALITQAAHQYGAHPSLLWLGIGLQRQQRGGDAARLPLLSSCSED